MSTTATFLIFFPLILLFATVISDPPVITHLETGVSFIRVSWKAALTTARKPVIGYTYAADPPKRRKYSDEKKNFSCGFLCLLLGSRSIYSGTFKEGENGDHEGDNGVSTRLVCVLAGTGGAILFIVMVYLLVKRCRSTGKVE